MRVQQTHGVLASLVWVPVLPTSVALRRWCWPSGFREEQIRGPLGRDAFPTCLFCCSHAASGQGLDTTLADVANKQGICAKGRCVYFSGACGVVPEALLNQTGAVWHPLAAETSVPRSRVSPGWLWPLLHHSLKLPRMNVYFLSTYQAQGVWFHERDRPHPRLCGT